MSEKILTDIRDLLRCLVKQTANKLLESELAKPGAKEVYELTGLKSQSEIAKLTGVSTGKISGLWQRWESIGLIVKDGKKYKRVV